MSSTAKEIFLKIKHIDAETEDSLTRFFLRLLKEETWSYQLRKEDLLIKKQSQEAYRKKLNKFVRSGFLKKGKRYFVDGKPRIPFHANEDVIKSIIQRYSFTQYEAHAAITSFRMLRKDKEWIETLDEKLGSNERMKLLNTLFPLIFMGKEISRFFFKLLFISVTRTTKEIELASKYDGMHKLLLDIMNNIELDITQEGIDYIGKRLFLDIYVKEVMTLLYATGAIEKHWDTMKVAILEDVTIPILTPVKPLNCLEKDYKIFLKKTPGKRFDEIVEHVNGIKDHFIKDYYGERWESELASYIAYAIKASIDNPNTIIEDFLKHLEDTYKVNEELINTVAREMERKIEQ
ncbi:hypothetical protein ACFLRF_06215 [Candidatus Altiarchaeota archaeon]